LLQEVDITVNRNAVPWDPRPPMTTSGLRIGTPALTTRGFGTEAFEEVADIIALTLIAGATGDRSALPELAGRVETLAQAHPLYPHLDPFGAEPWHDYSHDTPIFCGGTPSQSLPTPSLS